MFGRVANAVDLHRARTSKPALTMKPVDADDGLAAAGPAVDERRPEPALGERAGTA